MRRSEFVCHDNGLIKAHLDEIAFGTLVMLDSTLNPPATYCLPLSFCFFDSIGGEGAIGIHGARAGRKFSLLSQSPQVCFSAVKPYAYIGSEFLGGKMIPTQFFFSVMIWGRFVVVEDNAMKRVILSALVAKYEPQSQNFSFEKSAFSGSEKGVFVGFVEIEKLSVKAKFGQNLKEGDFEWIISDLQKCVEIGGGAKSLEAQTIEMMRYFRKADLLK